VAEGIVLRDINDMPDYFPSKIVKSFCHGLAGLYKWHITNRQICKVEFDFDEYNREKVLMYYKYVSGGLYNKKDVNELISDPIVKMLMDSVLP